MSIWNDEKAQVSAEMLVLVAAMLAIAMLLVGTC